MMLLGGCHLLFTLDHGLQGQKLSIFSLHFGANTSPYGRISLSRFVAMSHHMTTLLRLIQKFLCSSHWYCVKCREYMYTSDGSKKTVSRLAIHNVSSHFLERHRSTSLLDTNTNCFR
eukprot:314154_1